MGALHAGDASRGDIKRSPKYPVQEPHGPPCPPAPQSAADLGSSVQPIRLLVTQDPAHESRTADARKLPKPVMRHEDQLEMSPEQVEQLLVSVGTLPHRESIRNSFSRVEVGQGPEEAAEPVDRVLNEGLAIGQLNRGRGGLDVRIRRGPALRGGLFNRKPHRPTPRLFCSVCTVSPFL